MLDQLNDQKHQLLPEIAEDRPDLVPLYKTASITDAKALPKTAFADPAGKKFPIHTEEHAVLSKLYAEKQASTVPDNVSGAIDKVLELHGHDPEELTFPETEKQASSSSTSQYLLPQYQRLCVRSSEDVKPAVNSLMSQKNRLKTATVVEGSTNAVKYASEFGLDEDSLPSEVYKYAGLTTCDAGKLMDWLEARATACTKLAHRQMFDKLAHTVRHNFPPEGVIDDREELVKMASSIEEADKEAGLTNLYGRKLLDPVKTVFNMDKVASESVDLGGKKVQLSKLLSIPDDVYEEILGEGVIESAQGASGNIEADQFKALIETLPADLKTLLANTLESYL